MAVVSVVLVFMAFCTLSVSPGGQVEWRIVQYFNRFGLDATKDHCDSFLYLFKLTDCDLYFHLCLGWSGHQRFCVRTREYDNMNTVNFQNTLNNDQWNPITRKFDSWPGSANIHMTATDADNVSGDDKVDEMDINLNDVKADGKERRYSMGGPIHGGDSSFTFAVRVTCDRHYSGPDCTRYCKSADDPTRGHYRCTDAGEKQCLPHWQNVTGDCLDPAPCSPNPCENGGECQSKGTSYTCRCTPAYRGRHCETRIRPCERHDHCKNGGTCVDIGWTNSTCRCQSSWTGRFCDKDVDECSELTMACYNKATCVNTRGGYHCMCPKVFKGKTCMEDVNECLDTPCRNNGTCTNTYGGFKCRCSSAWRGALCEEDVNECSQLFPACRNGATCVNMLGGFVCQCPNGFKGSTCNEDINECRESLRSPCLNNGTCMNAYGSFNCRCPPGFNATAVCDEERSYLSTFVYLFLISLLFTVFIIICICREAVRGFMQRHNINYRLLSDDNDKDVSFPNAYQDSYLESKDSGYYTVEKQPLLGSTLDGKSNPVFEGDDLDEKLSLVDREDYHRETEDGRQDEEKVRLFDDRANPHS